MLDLISIGSSVQNNLLPATENFVFSGWPACSRWKMKEKGDASVELTRSRLRCPRRSSLGPVRFVPLSPGSNLGRVEPFFSGLDSVSLGSLFHPAASI